MRSWTDLGSLLAFRAAGLRGRARRVVPGALALLACLTVAAAVVPAHLPEQSLGRADARAALPSLLLSLLVVAVLSAAASGGGRELLPHEQGVAFPVGATTDHLGALLLAPLNIAWLLQAWAALAATSYVAGPDGHLLAAGALPTAWLLAATGCAQAVGWAVEWVRRGPRGVLAVRLAGLLAAAGAVALLVTGTLADVLRAAPTEAVARAADAGAHGRWGPWALTTATLLVLAVAAVAVGARLAGRVARRPAREELRAETAVRPARPDPASDLLALLRTDRAGIWRSVPMRRGAFVLAVLPGLVALGGSFGWDSLGVLPALVASGGALLFGVNAWCLDGRGALWRESLPVSPALTFVSRAVVLGEVLLVSSALTLVLASLRAGVPTASQAVAVLCAMVVVVVQVVATALTWSVRHPSAVHLRSARATPAPPLVMVGYSARLAVTTTLTGLGFDLAGGLSWTWPLLLAAPCLLWSALKLRRTARDWARPETRARVVVTVAS